MLLKFVSFVLFVSTVMSSIGYGKVPNIQEPAPAKYCIGVHYPGDNQYQAYGYYIYCDSRTKPTILGGAWFMFNFKSDRKVLDRAIGKAKEMGFQLRDTDVAYDRDFKNRTVAIFDNSAAMKIKPKEVILFNGSMIVNHTVGTKIKYDTLATEINAPALPSSADGDTEVPPSSVQYDYYLDHTTLIKNGFVKVDEFEVPYGRTHENSRTIYVYER